MGQKLRFEKEDRRNGGKTVERVVEYKSLLQRPTALEDDTASCPASSAFRGSFRVRTYGHYNHCIPGNVTGQNLVTVLWSWKRGSSS